MTAADYEQIRKHCRLWSEICENAVDRFLLYYVAHNEKLDREVQELDLR